MKAFFAISILIALFASIPYADYYLFSTVFPVTEEGGVLITGCSTGIGFHAAVTVSKENPNTIVYAGVRKDKDIENLLNQNIKNLVPIKLDISNSESMKKAVNFIESDLSSKRLPLIGLVNNAGRSASSPVEFHNIKDISELFNTNVFGTIELTQLVLPLLRKTKGSRIINISSILGEIALPTRGTYCASKAALDAYTDALRMEVANFDISVSSVQPAYVSTAIFEKVKQQSAELHKQEKFWDVYGEIYYKPENVEKRMSGVRKADPPSVTTEAINHALYNERPKAKYPVANVQKVHASYVLWFNWIMPQYIGDKIRAAMI